VTRHVTRPAPVCPAQTTYPGTFTRGQLRNPGRAQLAEGIVLVDGKPVIDPDQPAPPPARIVIAGR
jgi:hypothetical protein